MRIRIEKEYLHADFYDLMVNDFDHKMKRSPAQLPLLSRRIDGVPTPQVFLFDIGNCVEVITISGITDELSAAEKNNLVQAVKKWGYRANPGTGEGMPVLWEDPNNYYLGQFGHCSFDEQARAGKWKFRIEFKVLRKVHVEVPSQDEFNPCIPGPLGFFSQSISIEVCIPGPVGIFGPSESVTKCIPGPTPSWS